MVAQKLMGWMLAGIVMCAAAVEARAAEPPKLEGLTFVSKEKMEVGRGVNGPAMGNWKLTFKETKVSWRYSDVVESFDYTVDADGKISATSGMRKNKPIGGQYDAEKKELTWDGKVYTQQ
jgi:hypothetical protein